MNDLSASNLTAVATKVSLRSGMVDTFATWQARLTRAAGATSGFVSLEIIPRSSTALDWEIVQRFRSHDALERWRCSPQRASLFADLAPMTSRGAALADEPAPDLYSSSCVTEVITTNVAPGGTQAYQEWTEAVQAAQATVPGYMGTLVQAPLPPEIGYWTTLVRFATPAQLDAWLGSAERKAMLRRADPKVATWKSRRLPSPFGIWFEPREAGVARPPTWKQATLVLLVLFPVVMLEIRFLSPYLSGQHPAVATFIGNAISVCLTSWPLMPIAILGMGWWLRPKPERRWRTEFAGAFVLLALYAIEMATFVSLD